MRWSAATSIASHPELLDLLAKEFAAHEFDLKFLIRAITATQAYQLTSAGTHKSQDDPTLFARMPLRGLTAEQLFDSLAMATGYRDSGGGDDLLSGLLGGNRSARSEFLTKLRPVRPAHRGADLDPAGADADERQGDRRRHHAWSKRDAGRRRRRAVPDHGRAHRDAVPGDAVAQADGEGTRPAGAVRRGRRQGRARTQGRPTAYSNALADVFWALLNSPEFVLNH